MTEEIFVACAPGWQDNGPGGMEEEVRIYNSCFTLEFCRDGRFEDLGHGRMRVGQGVQWNPVVWTPEVTIDSKADVVVV